MTATDTIRAMLDERGVEHFDGTETTLWGYEPTGESTGAYRFAADETSGGHMQVRMFNLTPEQAIEATLGGDLKAENEKLQDENERLRSCLSDSAENSKQIMHEAHVQEEENAKLRELVADLWEYIYIGTAQDGQSLHDRTRELGVEV